MKKYSGWIVLLIFIFICAGGVWLTLQVTKLYPVEWTPIFLGLPILWTVFLG